MPGELSITAALNKDPAATHADVRAAEALLADALVEARPLGSQNMHVLSLHAELALARTRLAEFQP